jgi:hypothetical protein
LDKLLGKMGGRGEEVGRLGLRLEWIRYGVRWGVAEGDLSRS